MNTEEIMDDVARTSGISSYYPPKPAYLSADLASPFASKTRRRWPHLYPGYKPPIATSDLATPSPPLPSNWDLAAWHIQSATAKARHKRRWWWQRAIDGWRT